MLLHFRNIKIALNYELHSRSKVIAVVKLDDSISNIRYGKRRLVASIYIENRDEKLQKWL